MEQKYKVGQVGVLKGHYSFSLVRHDDEKTWAQEISDPVVYITNEFMVDVRSGRGIYEVGFVHYHIGGILVTWEELDKRFIIQEEQGEY